MKAARSVGSGAWKAVAGTSLLLLLLLSVTVVGMNVLNRPVSFDGSMNLQVAQSLANGHGYVREYDGVRPFPAEVQTNVPYVVPAALVFAVFGVGVVQSQAVNFLYMLGFLALVIAIGRRFHSLIGGLLAALVLIVVPGFTWIGMNGWGELVALFWWLAGTFLLLGERPPGQRAVAAAIGAMCLGLAVATKTVMLIGLGATACVYGLWVVLSCHKDARAGLQKLIAFGLWVVVPLLLVEAWRLHSMGLPAYQHWWGVQLSAITTSTGVMETAHPRAHSKLFGHFQILASLTGMPPWVVAVWLVAPVLWAAQWLGRKGITTAHDRFLLALTLVVSVYCVWWLMVTPDTHVRLRRIEIGLILNQWLWIFCLYGLLRTGRPSLRWFAIAGTIVFTLVTAAFARGTVLDLRKKSGDMATFQAIIATVKSLPASAHVFGKGFLSAPSIGLYAGRRIDDIDTFTAAQLAAMGSGYIVVDGPAAKSKRFQLELVRYAHTSVLDYPGFHLYRLDFARRLNPFNDGELASGGAKAWVDFERDHAYPLTFGFLKPSAAGWRWARTDAELLLKYSGEPTVALQAYRPGQSYARPGALELTVSLEGCLLGTQALPAGKHELRFPVTERCRPAIGQNARLQIESNNLMPPTALSLQQYSYVLSAAGFRE